MKIQPRTLPLLVALGALFLVACSQPQPSLLRIGTNTWPGYEPLYLARELGYLKDLNIRLVEHTSATQVIRGFRNKTIDAAALTLDEVLLLAQSAHQPRIVLVMDISVGGDAIIGRDSIRSIHDLGGKKIGVEKSALGAYILSRALEINNVPAHEVETVTLEAIEHVAAFQAGKVDAVVTFEPARSTLLNAGARELFSSTQIPNEILDVLVVREKYLKEHPEQINALIEKWFQALSFMRNHELAAAELMAPRLKLPASETLKVFDGLRLPNETQNRSLLFGRNGQPELSHTIKKLNEHMLKNKLLRDEIMPAMLLPSKIDLKL